MHINASCINMLFVNYMSVVFIDKIQLALFVMICRLDQKLNACDQSALYTDWYANFLIAL